jgi:hypothetical protein
MFNRGWRVAPPQQTQVTIDRIYDRNTGKELTHSEAACAERIRSLEEDLAISNNENRGLRERVVEAETIVSNIRMASESSHNDNPYPKTKTTSKSLNTELANFCLFYNLKLDFPKEFICPITQDIMVYPVTTSGGHTYEWSAISHWFKDKNNKDPVTNKVLNNNILYPNHTLRSLISNFIPTCKFIINELRKKEVLKETQGSIRMRSAPAEYGTRSKLYVKPNIHTRTMLSTKTRTKSKVKSSSKSRAITTAKARATEKAPSSQRFIQELDAQE